MLWPCSALTRGFFANRVLGSLFPGNLVCQHNIMSHHQYRERSMSSSPMSHCPNVPAAVLSTVPSNQKEGPQRVHLHPPGPVPGGDRLCPGRQRHANRNRYPWIRSRRPCSPTHPISFQGPQLGNHHRGSGPGHSHARSRPTPLHHRDPSRALPRRHPSRATRAKARRRHILPGGTTTSRSSPSTSRSVFYSILVTMLRSFALLIEREKSAFIAEVEYFNGQKRPRRQHIHPRDPDSLAKKRWQKRFQERVGKEVG